MLRRLKCHLGCRFVGPKELDGDLHPPQKKHFMRGSLLGLAKLAWGWYDILSVIHKRQHVAMQLLVSINIVVCCSACVVWGMECSEACCAHVCSARVTRFSTCLSLLLHLYTCTAYLSLHRIDWRTASVGRLTCFRITCRCTSNSLAEQLELQYLSVNGCY